MKKYVSIMVVGGLGNQLFCYAFGRGIAHYTSRELLVDNSSGFVRDPYGREYLLDVFKAVRHRQPSRIFFSALFRKLSVVLQKPLPRRQRFLFQEQAPWRYYEEILNTKYRRNNIGFSGYWQSYRYFEAISSILRADLKPPSPKSPAALELLLKIHECSSCFVHWRSYKETESELPAVNMDYYLKAITLMREHCADMHFFIFSDHLEGAKNLFRKIGNRQQFTFVDLPESKGNRGSLDDFALMYETDHAIIADSSFSWWAAWLKVPKINQCIVCPAGVSPWGEDWSPASWKKIQSK